LGVDEPIDLAGFELLGRVLEPILGVERPGRQLDDGLLFFLLGRIPMNRRGRQQQRSGHAESRGSQSDYDAHDVLLIDDKVIYLYRALNTYSVRTYHSGHEKTMRKLRFARSTANHLLM